MAMIRAGNFFAVSVDRQFLPSAELVKLSIHRDPGPLVSVTTEGGLIKVTVKSDQYQPNPAFTVRPIVMRWTGENRCSGAVDELVSCSTLRTSHAPVASTPTTNGDHAVTLKLNDITHQDPRLYRYVRLEIRQIRYNDYTDSTGVTGPIVYTVYSQPIYIEYNQVALPNQSDGARYETREWIATGSCSGRLPCALSHNGAIGLYNNTIKEWLKYGHQDVGINLNWTGLPDSSIRIVRQDGAGPVRYGDQFAVYIQQTENVGKYIKYQSRDDDGINIGWSDTPAYEWTATGGGAGSPVYFNQPFGLKNVNSNPNSEVVYCHRRNPFAAQVRWRKDCSGANSGREVFASCTAGACDIRRLISY
jgi:hypothetical protein